MTQAQRKPSYKFYALRIMRVIHKIRVGSYQVQDVFLKNKQALRIAKNNV